MNLKNAIKLSLLLSLFWYLIAILGYKGFTEWTERIIDLSDIFTYGIKQFAINTISFFVLFCFQFSIFNKKWKIKKKIWISIVVSLLIMLFFIVFIRFISYFSSIQSSGSPNVFFISAFVISITTITILLTCLLYIIDEREKTIIENQKLSVENMRARYETLKSQINPHFLFNSLNTLDGLIGLNDDKAKDFLQQLSFVFRYSIQNKEKTTLDDELVFIEAYCILMNIRYGQSLNIEYHINDKYRSHLIIPLSLQMLVENAIKHNTISNRYPLTITIETTDNSAIRVSNKIQPKSEDTSGEGIGLANLTERYKMLYQKEITISNSNGIFCVEIPLKAPRRGEEARGYEDNKQTNII